MRSAASLPLSRRAVALLVLLPLLAGALLVPGYGAAAAAAGAAGLAALVVFAARGAAGAGLLAAALACAAQAGGGVSKEEGMPAAALLAYLGMRAFSRSQDAERDAVDAACAVIGAAYTVSALSKLAASGLGWVDACTLRVLAAAEAAEGAGPLSALREGLAASPALARAGAGAALAIELCGAAMLRPRLRLGYAVAAAALHLATWLAFGILFWHWALVAAAFAYAGRPERRR